MEQTQNLPPIPGPFLLMAWLLNSHRGTDGKPLGFAEEESSWRGPCFDRSATAVWNAWMDSRCLFATCDMLAAIMRVVFSCW